MPRHTNLNPAHRRPGSFAVLRWAVLDRLTGRRRIAPAGPPADRVEADLDRVRNREDGCRFTWIGHSSFLVTIAGQHVLIDPVFSNCVGKMYRRYGEPGLTAAQLPPIDVLLISHSHYDHLDAKSLAGLDRRVTVIVPTGLGNWFRKRQFRNVAELNWWDSRQAGPLTVSLVPARHWSQRSPWDYNRSLWGGFVVSDGQSSLYHAGDSAAFDGFAEIGRRYPDLDVAMIPIGGYEPGWFMERNHMTPEQAVDAFAKLAARTMVPMHWGTFQLTDEPIRQPLERLRTCWEQQASRDARRLLTPSIGETVEVESPGTVDPEADASGSPG